MAVQHGMPGEWAKVRGTVRSLWPLGVCLVFLGAFAAAPALGRRLRARDAAERRRGQQDFHALRFHVLPPAFHREEVVAGTLARLSDDWHVFHDFEAGSHHVDHVLIGPAGVFAVETKNWRDPVRLESGELIAGGHVPDHPPIAQATAEAKAVKAVLARAGWTGEVVPVVCFASGTFQGGFTPAGKVLVANAEAFVKWLLEQPGLHAPGECVRLAQLMETRDL